MLESNLKIETTTQASLKCLQKSSDCESKDCETIVECRELHLKSHCFSVSTYDPLLKMPKILHAGCWSGGEECDPPNKLTNRIKEKIDQESYSHDKSYLDMLQNYTLSKELLDPAIQDKCIGYAKGPNDHSYLAKNNQTVCCCTGMVCNQNLAFVDELNPFTEFFKSLNPKRPISTTESSGTTHGNPNWFISPRDLTMICMSGLICLVIIGVICGLFYCFRFTSKKRKNSPYLSSIYYSRANSLNMDLASSNIGNYNHELTLLRNSDSFQINANHPESNILTLSDDGNFPLPNNHIDGENQPTAAPNVQILPNQNIMFQKSHMLKKKQPQSQSDEDKSSTHSLSLSNVMPHRLRASDIHLIEKISQGQFSAVWKSRCHSDLQKEEASEYAIKIFAGHQKTAWSNEKDIFKAMSAANDFILKFFGSDVHEGKKTEPPQPSFMITSDFWLITEYHPAGSLHDFLKKNPITWPQMVSLACSFFEGLAYLHSENVGFEKSFAIAHRDLKSKNILVKSDLQTCCIGDLGLALKLQNKNKLSSAEIRSKVGTKRYMSPELIEGAIAFTKETFLRIDVYASALVLWEIVSRGDFYDEKCEYKVPFQDEVGFNPSLDEMKVVVVDKCQRPIIKQEWLQNNQMSTLAQTIEECWDIDLDARISAECAAARIRKIKKTI